MLGQSALSLRVCIVRIRGQAIYGRRARLSRIWVVGGVEHGVSRDRQRPLPGLFTDLVEAVGDVGFRFGHHVKSPFRAIGGLPLRCSAEPMTPMPWVRMILAWLRRGLASASSISRAVLASRKRSYQPRGRGHAGATARLARIIGW